MFLVMSDIFKSKTIHNNGDFFNNIGDARRYILKELTFFPDKDYHILQVIEKAKLPKATSIFIPVKVYDTSYSP